MSHLVRSSIATCLVAAMCTIATTPGGAIAAEDFPHRTIKIIVPNPPGVRWMDHVPLGPDDRAKILSGNAKRLLKI